MATYLYYQVMLSSTHERINVSNKKQYVQLALEFRLHEFDVQVSKFYAWKYITLTVFQL